MNSIEITYEEGGDPQPGGITAPTFSPAAGEVAYGTQVTITAPEGYYVVYTTDGSDPTELGGEISDDNVATVTVNADMTIKAAATTEDFETFSAVVEAAYTLIKPDAPTFNPAAGKVAAGTEVTITAPQGCYVVYTTDGSDPTENGEMSEGNVATVIVNEALTIKALSIDDNSLESEVVEAAYTIASGDDPTPTSYVWKLVDASALATGDVVVIADKAGSFAMSNDNGTSAAPSATEITLNDAKDEITSAVADNLQWTVTVDNGKLQFATGDSYLYCTAANNGMRVGDNSNNVFSMTTDSDNNPFMKNDATSRYIGVYNSQDWRCYTSINNNIKATRIAFYKKTESGEEPGETVAAPIISGETPFVGSTTVTIEAEAGDIYYTLDGNDPTEESAAYTEPFEINATTTVKAIAVVDGKSSAVASKTFSVMPSVASIDEFIGSEGEVVFSSPVTVLGQNGNYLYVQDDNSTRGLLVFGSLNQAYEFGDVIPAGFKGSYELFRNQHELASPKDFAASVENVAGSLVPTEVTPAEVTTDNFGRYIVIKGATFSKTDENISKDNENVAVYNRFELNLPEDGVYDIYGIASVYNNNLQVLPLRFEEVVEEPGITLAEALAGQDGEVKIGGELAVVLKCAGYAIVSDGNDWLKVYSLDAEEGDVVTNLTGTISGLDLNPVLIATASEAVTEPTVQAEPTKMDFAYATYDTMKQLKSNQVIELVGYYKDGYIYQAAKGNGMHIAVSTDNMTGNFAEGQQQHFTGVVTFKEAWTPANGAPARISQDSDDAYTNITFDVTEAGVPTGVNTVKAFNGKDVEAVYNVNGQRVSNMGKGVYILRHTDGTTTKVLR